MRKRIGNIDFLKFLLAAVIILFHARVLVSSPHALFIRGYFAVDIFFLISGYFMAKTALARRKEPLAYLKEKYLGFFPYHTFCFILAFFCVAYLKGLLPPGSFANLRDLASLAIAAVPEFLILPSATGLQYKLANINGIEWYLSSMLMGMFILYPIIYKVGKKYCEYWSIPVFTAISGYMFLYNKATYNGTINPIANTPINIGVIRAIAGLSAGAFLCAAIERKAFFPFLKRHKTLATAAELFCWLLTFAYLNSSAPTKTEFAVIYFAIAASFLSLSQETHTAAWFDNRVSAFLGKFSFPLFLNQSWTRKLMIRLLKDRFPGWSYAQATICFIGITVVASLACIWIMDPLMKWIRAKRQAAQA